MDIIVLAGSSGNGKSTVGNKLHELLKSPFMEFTWIPEFRSLNPHTCITPKEEEQIAFVLVAIKQRVHDVHMMFHYAKSVLSQNLM